MDSLVWVPLYATLRSFSTRISIIWERRPKFESFATTLSAKKTSRASNSSYWEFTRAVRVMAATPLCTQSILKLRKPKDWPKMRNVTELSQCRSQHKTLSHLSKCIKCTQICTLCYKPFQYHCRVSLSLWTMCWKCSWNMRPGTNSAKVKSSLCLSKSCSLLCRLFPSKSCRLPLTGSRWSKRLCTL